MTHSPDLERVARAIRKAANLRDEPGAPELEDAYYTEIARAAVAALMDVSDETIEEGRPYVWDGRDEYAIASFQAMLRAVLGD